MSEVTPEKKSTILKLLAIFGFIAIIILCVWLAVQIVTYAPTAFRSLASLAESVDTVRPVDTPRLEITADRAVIQSGNTIELQWNTIPDANYTFSYSCTDGVALDAARNSELVPVSCDTPFAVGSDTSLMLRAASERSRFADVSYRVTAVSAETDSIIASNTDAITIMNATIPNATSTPDTEPTPDEEDTEEPTSSTPTPTEPSTPVTETPTTPGVADLSVTFRRLGVLDQYGTLIPRSSVDNDDPIAVEFTVTNLGTATSDVFTFIATLDGDTIFTSNAEPTLRPGQQATLTFEFTTDQDGRLPFAIVIDSDNEVGGTNNRFTETIRITD